MKRKTPANVTLAIRELKDGLAHLYGDRLDAVYLYGSYARGDYRSGSDVDVMILLKSYKDYWEELKLTSQLIQDVSLAHELTISRIFMTVEKWRQSDTPLLRNIRQDGLPA